MMYEDYKPPYKEGTTLFHIIEGGWCRDLSIMQIFNECHVMGYEVTIEDLAECLESLEKIYRLSLSEVTTDRIVSRVKYTKLREEWYG